MNFWRYCALNVYIYHDPNRSAFFINWLNCIFASCPQLIYCTICRKFSHNHSPFADESPKEAWCIENMQKGIPWHCPVTCVTCLSVFLHTMKCKLNSVSCGGESSTEDFNERKKGSFYTACCNANKASYILYWVNRAHVFQSTQK
jgi:hypothetical protein